MRYYKKIFKTLYICLILIALLISGCAPGVKKDVGLAPDLLWPLPPERPRVKLLYLLYRAEDLGVRDSWLAKAVNFIFGRGSRQRRLEHPSSIMVDGEGRIFVSDPGKAVVHIFDPKSKNYRVMGNRGKGRLSSPFGVAVAENGNIYVTDPQAGKIHSYDRKRTFLKDIGASLNIARPTGIAVKGDLVYIVDTVGHRVVAADTDGGLKFEFGGRGDEDGEFNFPTGIAIDAEGKIYVSDSLNFRIQVFNPTGEFISKFGKIGDGRGDFSRPKGVAVDSEGHIYVVDGLFDVVQVFDDKGTFLLSFGQSGGGPGEFWLPSGIYIDRNDTIYVADSFNHRVQVFQYLGGYDPE